MKANVVRLVEIPDTQTKRIKTGIKGFDKFLGGGLIPGSTILFAGEPGVGKSTFLLQVADSTAKQGQKVLYASGEENLTQIKARANRLGTLHPEIWCAESLHLEELFQMVRNLDPAVIVVDSIQLLHSDTLKQSPGSSAQIRSCLLALIEFAKKTNKILVTIGHSTKSGKVAGLLALQHMVDVVLYMRNIEGDLRQLEAKKNRFGPTSVNWIVRMTGEGLSSVDTEIIKSLKHEDIIKILDGHTINKLMVGSDMRWLYEQAFGSDNLHNIIKYDIIYTLENEDKKDV